MPISEAQKTVQGNDNRMGHRSNCCYTSHHMNWIKPKRSRGSEATSVVLQQQLIHETNTRSLDRQSHPDRILTHSVLDNHEVMCLRYRRRPTMFDRPCCLRKANDGYRRFAAHKILLLYCNSSGNTDERERASTDFIASLRVLMSRGIRKRIADSHHKHKLLPVSSCHALTFFPSEPRLVFTSLSSAAADGARPAITRAMNVLQD